MVGKSKQSKLSDTTTVKEGDMTAVDVRKMKSLVLTTTSSSSDYSNLQVKDEEYPKIDKDDQVLIKIKAVGLNFSELMQRQGMFKPSTKTPYTPGYEGSGIVEEVSGNITDLKKDDRVIVFSPSGIWKETVLVAKANVMRMPEEMTFEEAAGLFVNYLTAYQLLFRSANIREGDKVLVHMADSGVGIAAIQLCKTIPNITIFGTAPAGKHETIKEWGVEHLIDCSASDYVEEVKKACPEGVDVVLDPLNGENAIKGYDLLKPLGRIVHYGMASMTSESRSITNMFKTWWKSLSTNSLEIISENKSISGYHLVHLLNNQAFMSTIITDMNALLKMYTEKKIQILVDHTYGYSKIGEAMKRIHQRLNVGKVILKPDSEMPVPEVTTPEVEAVATTLEQVKLSTESQKTETSVGKSEETKTEVKSEEVKTEVKSEEAKAEVKCEESQAVPAAQPAPEIVATPKIEEKIIEKTTVSEITKPESTEGECATRE